jgi:uncharacterized DUF497 family protein
MKSTPYSRRRMAMRGITTEEVDEVLAAPDTVYSSADYPDERTVVLGRTSGGRRLKVVVRADDNEFVITVADRDSEA